MLLTGETVETHWREGERERIDVKRVNSGAERKRPEVGLCLPCDCVRTAWESPNDQNSLADRELS